MCRNERCSNWFVNEGPKTIVIIIWVLANVAVFFERFWHYYDAGQKYAATPNQPDPETKQSGAYFAVLGYSLCAARASAASIKLNMALVLLFVLRNFLSWLRGTWVGSYFPVDKNIVFHKYLAAAIAIMATVHCTSHYCNYRKLSDPSVAAEDLLAAGILKAPNNPRPTLTGLSWTTIPGATGHILTISMILMYTSAVESVRRPSFEAFWYTHHLFIIFYGLLMGHGAAALLEFPTFWAWTCVPLLLYAIERIIRIARGKQACIVLQAIAHPSRVLELRMKKQTFNYIPGQYCFIACPYIANYEWHPFTISSSPDEDFLSLHIRLAGDWTGKLHQLFNPNKKGDGSVVQENMVNAPNGSPIIMIDGPFGAASEDVFKFETVMLWAAGIGVTPFASILKAIRHAIQIGDAKCPIKRVEFYWINREKTSFEWFIDLLAELERTCDFLSIQLFFTGKVDKKDMVEREDGTDALTGLSSKTHYGRPDIDAIFAQRGQDWSGRRIGVFFCGPPIVSKMLYTACKTFTDSHTKTKYVYHKENF